MPAKNKRAVKTTNLKTKTPVLDSLVARSMAMDYFRNPAARTGWQTPSLPESTEYVLDRISLNYWLTITLYRNSWICRRVVDVPASDMVRAWPRLNSELEPKDIQLFDRRIRKTFTPARIEQAMKWAGVFGGAGCLICIKGHENRLDEPLDLDEINPKSYMGLIPFDRWVGVSPSTSQLCTDMERPQDWGLPEFYEVRPEANAKSFNVHCSRILRFTGPQVPTPELQAQSYWGISRFELIYEEMKKRDNASFSMLNLLFRANILAQKNPELAQMLSGASMNQAALQKFTQIMQAQNQLLSNQTMMILGEDGELFSTQFSFSGLADLYAQFQMDLAGAAEIPVTRLFGRTLSGLGQSNDADERYYEEKIAHDQSTDLRPQLEKLYPVIFMSEFGEVPDDLDFDFPSVRVLTEEEKSKLATEGSAPIIAAYNSGLTWKSTALKDLHQLSDTAGIFTNITQEEIDDAPDEALNAGEEFGAEPGGEPGAEGEEEKRGPGAPNVMRELRKEAGGALDEHPTKKRTTWHGMNVSIEHPAGSIRSGKDPAGNPWQVKMTYDYGYLHKTQGVDGDHLDVFMGPDHKAEKVYVVHTRRAPDFVDYDEDKAFLDFASEADARAAFFANYDRPEHFGSMDVLTVGDFIDKALGTHKKPQTITADSGFINRLWSRLFRSRATDDFREEDHPRARSGSEAGQFVKKGQEGSAGPEKPESEKESKREESAPAGEKRETKKPGRAEKSESKSSHLQAVENRESWPEHIKALKIPPAWKDVKIATDPDANLLAISKDAKGRAQYVYSEKFARTQAALKFARIQSLEKDSPMIENQLADLRKSDDQKMSDLAECATLVMKMGIRPGSDTDTQAKVKAYGATTLEGKHVVHEDGEIYLRFTGKKGVNINLRVEDPDLAKALQSRAQAAGENGRIFGAVQDTNLREFVSTQLDHGSYHPKDMRTLLANKLAVNEMAGLPEPKTEKEYRKSVLKVAKAVSAKLGNTATVALQSYINPTVFGSWRQSYGGTA